MATLTAAEQLKKDLKMKVDQKAIQQAMINLQAEFGAITNKMDAFNREYESDAASGQMYIWSQSISGSANKMKGIARANLIKDKLDKSIKTDHHRIHVSWTVAGLTLDTTKFKKLDRGSYDVMAKLFTKKSNPSAKIKVEEK